MDGWLDDWILDLADEFEALREPDDRMLEEYFQAMYEEAARRGIPIRPMTPESSPFAFVFPNMLLTPGPYGRTNIYKFRPNGLDPESAVIDVTAVGVRPIGTPEGPRPTRDGFKKLDVNYSTIELGLALGVSIKTINYRDRETQRYTKNYSRVNNELRAEAMDYHQRQPYAVLVGLLFLPVDAADDAGQGRGAEVAAAISSFGAAVRYFRNRAPRRGPDEPPDLFERFFVGLYSWEDEARGKLLFYDVERALPPRDRRPALQEALSLEKVADQIRQTYDERNNPPFDWAPD